MAIRIRQVDGTLIALCAAETDHKEGDLYLDDGIHFALVTKFSEDYKLGISESRLVELMQQEKMRDAKEEIEKWIKSQT